MNGRRRMCVVVAPSGIDILGTEAASERAAIASLMIDPAFWGFARTQGYRTRWVWADIEEDDDRAYPPSGSPRRPTGSGEFAGPITIPQFRWGASRLT